jgi:hypothetical protein
MNVNEFRAKRTMITDLGRLLDDLESLRIRNNNRVGATKRRGIIPDPFVVEISDQVKGLEDQIVKQLIETATREFGPLFAWADSYRGLGKKSLARLLAAIGDPATGTTGHWEDLEGEKGQEVKRIWVIDDTYERSVSQLWSYCGHGAPGRRTKNMSQEDALRLGNPHAKKQVWQITTGMLKAGNRAYYDARREQTKDKLHDTTCIRCGPSGKPATVGTPWKDGHKHADALRVSGKEFLKDLWLTAQEASMAEAA